MKTILVLLLCLTLMGLAFFWRAKEASPAGMSRGPAVSETSVSPAHTGGSSVGVLAGGGQNKRALLLPGPETTWEQAAAGSPFGHFSDWTHRYRSAATKAEKAALEGEGVSLARERLDALAALIQANPEQALQLALPLSVRMVLPASVESLLEERVSAKGDLMVVAALPLPGQEDEIKSISRLANIGDK